MTRYLETRRRTSRLATGWALLFGIAATFPAATALHAAEADPETVAAVEALAPDLEAYVEAGMKDFDVPGTAIGIVVGDELVYARGFGVRARSGDSAVEPATIFQIGSTTKAFLATTMAIAVDRDLFQWDDKVVDLLPDFQLLDPWVTREFRMFDLLAQRSGLPPYANDDLASFGYDEDAKIHSLRYVAPVSSFRTTFAYTNITHLIAGRIVASVEGAADWYAVLQKDILDPLGMDQTTRSRRRPTTPTGTATIPTASPRSPSTSSSPMISAAPARSTRRSSNSCPGSACCSTTAPSMARRSSRRATSPPPGWRGSP